MILFTYDNLVDYLVWATNHQGSDTPYARQLDNDLIEVDGLLTRERFEAWLKQKDVIQ